MICPFFCYLNVELWFWSLLHLFFVHYLTLFWFAFSFLVVLKQTTMSRLFTFSLIDFCFCFFFLVRMILVLLEINLFILSWFVIMLWQIANSRNWQCLVSCFLLGNRGYKKIENRSNQTEFGSIQFGSVGLQKLNPLVDVLHQPISSVWFGFLPITEPKLIANTPNFSVFTIYP